MASPKELHPVSRDIQAVVGLSWRARMTGMTAWAGLNLVEVKARRLSFLFQEPPVRFGNVAGQLAKLRGCRVIGSAGSMAKVMFLREECGFDVAFDYKAGPVLDQLNLEGAGRD